MRLPTSSAPLPSPAWPTSSTETPETGGVDAACTGSNSALTAPAGKVCIYINASAGIDISTLVVQAGTLTSHGFTMTWSPLSADGGGEDVFATGAYAAP